MHTLNFFLRPCLVTLPLVLILLGTSLSPAPLFAWQTDSAAAIESDSAEPLEAGETAESFVVEGDQDRLGANVPDDVDQAEVAAESEVQAESDDAAEAGEIEEAEVAAEAIPDEAAPVVQPAPAEDAPKEDAPNENAPGDDAAPEVVANDVGRPAAGGAGVPEAARQAARQAVLIEFTGEITTLSEQYLYRKLDRAREMKADLIVLQVDSPGGDAEASIRMGQRLRDLGWAITVAYVPEQALSGAAIFSLGCDDIIMHPNAVFGDAGPIFLDENFLFQHASEKYRSHLARQVRDLAAAKGRSPAIAEAMVDMNLVVYQMTNRVTGRRAYLSQAEIDALDDADVWERGKPVLESREDHFLELNGRRAVELGFSQATVQSLEGLKARYEPLDKWVELPWTTLDTTVMVLNHPLATGLLFVVGLIALYIEFAAPGLGIGGILAMICFALFFWSRFLGGTAEWLDLVLFLAGLALLMIELFVIPGFGIWGASGITLLLVSLLLASQSFLVPRTRQDLNELTRSLSMILVSTAAFLVLATLVTKRLGTLPGLSNLMLQPPEPAFENGVGQDGRPREILVNGQWIRLGQQGRAESPLRPAGRITLGDDFVDVVSDGSFIDRGELVQVIDLRGNRIVVRRVETPA
jgi:membrane-bound serine protease (ClpP class)